MNEQRKKQPFYYSLHAVEFKERCLELIDEIYRDGDVLIVTDGSMAVAEVTRYVEPPLGGYGSLKGRVEILGDIEGPMPVEWYTDPNVQTDEDWDISGPMPASWFVDPNEGKPREYRKPEKVDVSVLHRHRILTLDTGEFVAQLEEVIAAVSESEDGLVIVFDDEKPLVQVKPNKGIPDFNQCGHVGEEPVH
ncbi:MAG: hypothetical protein F4X64_03430 [Chloroflexi bacterium]|nr:hypothetical protein [Chloroflexota bacterium]